MTDTRTILVTGATGSIGGAAAKELVARGSSVVLLGPHPHRLMANAGAIRDVLTEQRRHVEDASVATMAVDFSNLGSVRRAASEAASRWPIIDGLILSVGA